MEIDAVVTLRNGDWAAIEVKLGSQEYIDEGARNLLKLVDSMDPRSKKPSFLMFSPEPTLLTKGKTGYGWFPSPA